MRTQSATGTTHDTDYRYPRGVLQRPASLAGGCWDFFVAVLPVPPCSSPFRKLWSALVGAAALATVASATAQTTDPYSPRYEPATTHRALTHISTRTHMGSQVMRDFLNHTLLLQEPADNPAQWGINTPANGRALWEWACQGAVDEDDLIPDVRVRRHFYNPINDSGLFGGVSSLLWAWDHNGNEYSWKLARAHYWTYLNATNQSQKEDALAATMYCLGHVAHLVQDLAQPQHVRGDAHLTLFPGSPYESYCSARFGTPESINALGEVAIPDFSGHPNPSPPGGVPPEFASFWDTGQYQGVFSSGSFVQPLGLAEYSSFFYISDDSMFPANGQTSIARGAWTIDLQDDPDQPSRLDNFAACWFPRLEHTNLIAILPPGQHTLTRWGHSPPMASHPIPMSLAIGTETIENFCSLEYFDVAGVRQYQGISLRDENYQVHAERLLPKAAAYSAGVLNYFFRGKLDVTLTREGGKNKLTVVNGSDETIGVCEWKVLRETVSGGYEPIPDLEYSPPQSLAPGAELIIRYADVDLCKPIGTITVACKGEIGHEQYNAIAVGRVRPSIAEYSGVARYTYAGGCSFSPTIQIRIRIDRQYRDHVQAQFTFLPAGNGSGLRLDCGPGQDQVRTEGTPPWWEATISNMGNHLVGLERHFGCPIGPTRVIGTITLDRID